MNTPFMQWLDGHAGPPLCWIQSLLFRKEKPFPERVEKILIIKMFGLGSMIMMTPMVRSIRNSFPSAKIYFMTFAGNKDIPRCYNLSDELLTIRKDNLLNFLLDSLRNIRRVRKDKVDIVIDAEFFSRYTALITSLCRKPFIVGFFNYNMYRGHFLDRRCYFNQYFHMKRNFMELANAFCKPYGDLTISCPDISKNAEKAVEKIIQDSGFQHHPIVVLNPNTSNITPSIDRSWPLEQFGKIGDYLSGKGYRIFVIGDSRQKERSENLAEMCGRNAVSLAGRTSIEEMLALIKRAFCVITNDSAPFHIAVSERVPAIAFFGTDTPMLYGSTDPIHTMFFKGFPCSPCLSVFNYKKGKCEFNSRCVKTITCDEVIREFEKKEDILKKEYEKKKA